MTASSGLIHASPPQLPKHLPLAVTSVALGISSAPEDWIGRWQHDTKKGERAWRLLAADLAVDRLTGKNQMRQRSFSDRLGQMAKKEGWTGFHHFGLGEPGPLVTAVAAAELDLPFLMSFGDGEVEAALYSQPGVLRTVLRGATAFTAPSVAEVNLVRRFLAPADLPAIVARPEALTPGASNACKAESPQPVLGCWGCHGRESGLPLLLDLAAALRADLCLVGPFSRSEMYEMTEMIDHHPMSEKIVRLGDLADKLALDALARCQLAVFPLTGPSQCQYALKALAAGCKVLAHPVGALGDVEGLCAVTETDGWQGVVETALTNWQPPASGWATGFSQLAVAASWEKAYRLAGLCT